MYSQKNHVDPSTSSSTSPPIPKKQTALVAATVLLRTEAALRILRGGK